MLAFCLIVLIVQLAKEQADIASAREYARRNARTERML